MMSPAPLSDDSPVFSQEPGRSLDEHVRYRNLMVREVHEMIASVTLFECK